MIKLENIHKSFGKNEVLKGIDLEVRKGDIISILGPSGSGKTTLLRSINFLDKATSGTVTIDNLSLDAANASKKSIIELRKKTGMVFQNYNLFQHKTVLENVIEGPVIVQKRSIDEAKELAYALLEKVGLSHKADAYPSSLSGGQQQRVGIARALAMNPQVLLLDEPTSALDPISTNKMEELMVELKKQYTVVIVTHNMQQAGRIADKTAFFLSGEVVEYGNTEDIFYRPRDKRTEDYITGRFG